MTLQHADCPAVEAGQSELKMTADRTAETDASRPERSVDLDASAIALVGELRNLRGLIRDLERRHDDIRQQILDRLGIAEIGTIAGSTVVEIRRVDEARIDTARLRAERPDIVDRYLIRRSSSRVLLR